MRKKYEKLNEGRWRWEREMRRGEKIGRDGKEDERKEV